MTVGVWEDIEMEIGIGFKPLINKIQNSLKEGNYYNNKILKIYIIVLYFILKKDINMQVYLWIQQW